MAIKYLPGWTWHYEKAVINGKRVTVDRYATDPSGRVYTVRQTQNAQKQAEAQQGVQRPAPQPRTTRRYTRRNVSLVHGAVTEIYFDSLNQAQEQFIKMCQNNDPRVTSYNIWYIQVLYTALIAQRDTNTAKQVPRTITYTERGVQKTRRITQERAALSSGYNRTEAMCESDEPWDDARQREGNFTIRRIVLYGAER